MNQLFKNNDKSVKKQRVVFVGVLVGSLLFLPYIVKATIVWLDEGIAIKKDERICAPYHAVKDTPDAETRAPEGWQKYSIPEVSQDDPPPTITTPFGQCSAWYAKECCQQLGLTFLEERVSGEQVPPKGPLYFFFGLCLSLIIALVLLLLMRRSRRQSLHSS